MIWLLVTLLCDYLETLWPENIFNITWCLSIPPLSLYWMLDRDLLTYKEGRLQQDGLVGVNMHSYYCMYGTLDSLRCTLHDLYSFKWWVPGGTGSDEAYTELSAGGKPCYTRFFPQRSFEERLVCHLNTKLIFGICTAIWKCKVWLFVCTLMRPLQERAHFTTIIFFKSSVRSLITFVCLFQSVSHLANSSTSGAQVGREMKKTQSDRWLLLR